MKRVHLQKEKPVPHFYQEAADSPSAQPDTTPPGAMRRARTSAAMIGLALSMGATSLLLPRQDDGAAAAEPKVPDTAISATLSPSLDARSDAQPSGTAQFPTVRLDEHLVQDGQTLQQIATRYGVTVQSIALANDLSLNAELRVGQTLKIPVPNRAAAQSPASSLVASASIDRLPTAGDSHQLEESQKLEESQRTDRNSALDRLRQQRDKLRDSLAELRREEPTLAANSANPVEQAAIDHSAESNLLQSQANIARTLAVLPTLPATEATSPVTAEESVGHSTATTESVAVRPQPEVDASGIRTYRVNPGDTLARIARTYNIPQSLLINANRLSDPNVIFVGQVLTVPSVPSSNVQPPVAVASEDLSAGVLPAVAPIGGSDPSSTQPRQIAVANAIQPAIAPAAPASPTLVSQAQPAAPTAPGRQVAVAPLPEESAGSVPIAPGVDGTGSVDSDLSSRFNPYVANLLTELRGLRQQTQPEVAAAVQPSITPAAASPATAGEMAVAPHFNESINRDAATLPISNSVQAPSAPQSSLVAVAPLGSESYDPLLQPVTGRLVSPDLPPLPGADSFLPEDGISDGYIWPARGMLTSGYGWRWGRMHQGIDIAADVGTPIYAAATGTVEFAGWNSGGYGNMVEIRHADGSMTRYAHMNAIHVEIGQRVDQGDQLGEMGSTGYSTGPHLHFEVHLPNQGTVNPIAYLPTDQTAQR